MTCTCSPMSTCAKCAEKMRRTIPVGYVLRPTTRDEDINRCIDEYLTAQRKAKAWDELLAMADRDWPDLVPTMDRLMSQILEK